MRQECNHHKWSERSESDLNNPKIDHQLRFIRAFKMSNLRFSGLSKYQLHQVGMHPWQVTKTVMTKSLWSLRLLCRNNSKVKLQCLSFAELSIFSIYCHSKNSLSLSLICSWHIKWRCMLHSTSVCHQYRRVWRKHCSYVLLNEDYS